MALPRPRRVTPRNSAIGGRNVAAGQRRKFDPNGCVTLVEHVKFPYGQKNKCGILGWRRC